MQKKIKINVILALVFGIALLGLLFSLEHRFNKSILAENKSLIAELEGEKLNAIYLTNEANYLAQFHTFRNALKDIDIIEYDRETNNCWDQSQALQAKLREMGIDSTIAVVDGREHAFLMVWIEATTGDFIPPDKGYKLIEFRGSKYDVICNNE